VENRNATLCSADPKLECRNLRVLWLPEFSGYEELRQASGTKAVVTKIEAVIEKD
jgi:hypothetical protein